MMAALYLQVSIVSQALIFVTRSRSWSFVERHGFLLLGAFLIAQLIATLIAVYANWGFVRIQGCGWGWAGVIWVYSVVFYFPLDIMKFATRYALSGKAWVNMIEQRATPLISGLAVATVVYAGKYSIQAWNAFKARPPTVRMRKFYEGGFQPTMTRREAALILGVKYPYDSLAILFDLMYGKLDHGITEFHCPVFGLITGSRRIIEESVLNCSDSF